MPARREPRPEPQFRPARVDDVEALVAVERGASLAALGHIFPPDEYPYPTDDIRARWLVVLADPSVTTLLLESEERPGEVVAFVAFDADRIRHLAVHPRHWRHGHARRALDVATARMETPTLWMLEQNHRARGLYEHLGWVPTGRSRPAEFPPHPTEIELAHRP